MFSRDLEDIVTIFDGRSSFVSEVASCGNPLGTYLQGEIQNLLGDPEFIYSLRAFVRCDERAASRIAAVKARMKEAASRR